MGIESIAALSMAGGAAWASGLNLYATLLALGIMGSTGTATLPPDLAVLEHPLVMTAAGFMYCVEFFADKIPGFDSLWDALHTFVRIPAGAVLAAGAVGEVDPAVQFAALIVGGALAASTHAAKSSTRAVINTSPEPFTNWTASVTEDVVAITGLWAALTHPYLFLSLLVVFLLVLAWLLPKIFRLLRSVFRRLVGLFKRGPATASQPSSEMPQASVDSDAGGGR